MDKNSDTPTPLTFDLPVSLIEKINTCRESLGFGSVSEVVREAMTSFDYSAYEATRIPHRQISVRIPAKQRSTLSKFAKQKKVSVGELLRVALEGLFTRSASAVAKANPKQGTSMAKKAAKKPVKKAAVKKVVKKAAKKK